ncbi:DUF4352 domain-containing protein [Streptomyces phaeolivaceus]|uniref:DUF4352 domain-containing protein n=1 Tax=Streptomyces phaeolivaceus TaxID=2653200 RepID=A0A5P8K488_9ACTN|nr:DUF4352 domain-containing protein [Streptomyces phaeolivaceus]QFQ97447.1 DUF4352 domain-containing protein [Streptomyces phaeolivaceus]
MNQQYPQQPQQPGWGQQPQQHPHQPGWGAPPPPPKKTPVGMIVGLGCLGVVVLLVIIGALGAVVGNDNTASSKGTSVSTDDKNVEAEKKDDTPAAEDKPAEEPAKEEAAPEPDVKIVAKKTAFTPTILATGSNYTSVKVTVTNNSDDTISVNVLYFEITDSKGTKHSAELGVDENQIDTVDLAPGENVSGAITSKGKFTAKHVTYTQFLEDPVRVAVS